MQSDQSPHAIGGKRAASWGSPVFHCDPDDDHLGTVYTIGSYPVFSLDSNLEAVWRQLSQQQVVAKHNVPHLTSIAGCRILGSGGSELPAFRLVSVASATVPV